MARRSNLFQILALLSIASIFVSFVFYPPGPVSNDDISQITEVRKKINDLDLRAELLQQETDEISNNNIEGDDDNDEIEVINNIKNIEESEEMNNHPISNMIISQDEKKLLQQYHINERDRNRCLQHFETQLVPMTKFKSKNIHDQLYQEIALLAGRSACFSSRKYILYRYPHFKGGRYQFLRYFQERQWIGSARLPASNQTGNPEGADDTVALIAPCLYTLPLASLQRTIRVISMSPKELKNALKIPFYKSIIELFNSLGCDYRTFHPESFLVDNNEQCESLLRVLQNEPLDSDAVWFFKSR